MTPEERFDELCARLDATLWTTAIVVPIPRHHTVYLNTTSGPSSCISDELRDWLTDHGLRQGSIQVGWWENWPQWDDEDPRNLVYFNIVHHEIAMLFKLTFGGS